MEIKGMSSFLTDDKIVHVDRYSSRIYTEVPGTNKSNKVSGHKVSAYKSMIFLYTSTEQLKFKIKITILFATAPKNT